jgi:hypothetical protein
MSVHPFPTGPDRRTRTLPPLDNLANRKWGFGAELRAAEAERVELASLAARIDPGR